MTDYGFYSETAAQEQGAPKYLTPSGRIVLVTGVSKDQRGNLYTWPDKKFVGEVTKFVESTEPEKKRGLFKKNESTGKWEYL